jgi:uncharacterized protein (TIGR00369 family)
MPTFTPKDPDWDAKVRASFARQTFLELLGARIEALQPGECALRLQRRPDLCQQHGFMHAGVTTTLADTGAGYAAFSLMPPGSSVLTTELKINLIAPADGESLVARASVIKPGRTLSTVIANVYAANGDKETHIAIFVATMMCMAGKGDKVR